MRNEKMWCPFCGEEIDLKFSDNGEGFAQYHIEHFCEKYAIDITAHDGNKYALIENINTRAQPIVENKKGA